ncbi:MAG: hypothetical protein KAX49_18440 [Halanaerobiales bacterium]|nr:hypothetical protein [Halanaerobiales bacterium]
MEKVHIFAPDLGNSYTDFVHPESLKVLSIPSLVAPARATRYSFKFNDLGKDNQGKSGRLKDLVLQTDEGTFFIGHTAFLKAGASKVKLSHDTEQSLFIKDKMLKTSMALSLPEVCQVKLLLGHPYSESHLAQRFVEMAMGEHCYKLNGKEYCHEVLEVETIAQPVAAFRGIVTDLNGKPKKEYASLFKVPVVVGDIGGGTFDICWIEINIVTGELEVIDHLSGSERLGVWYGLELISEEIFMRYGVKKPLVELEYELKGNKTEVNIDGKMVEIKSIKTAMYKQTADDILTYATNLWPESDKKRIGKFFRQVEELIDFWMH